VEALEIVRRLRSLADEIEAGKAPPLVAAPTLPPVVATPASGLAWGARVSPQFRAFVHQMAEDFAPAQPDWFMACMAFETGRTFSPKVKNPGSSATGLIQFMEATAAELKTTTRALAAMTAEKQLEYVWLYFRDRIRQRGPITRLTDCYMAILNPVAMGQPDSFAMWVKGSRAYAANAGLDTNKDHQITKAEAGAKVAALLAEGLRPENVA
jgi:hypothetical protein